ncbi:MAG TPA: glycosyltransferase family 2 protein [Candidatus Fimadaptatus faecigallinarum]|uniref:Glycosyltransferase family 2 protein n=1 Tax=Candidatus Fimadaptatus faecigallinarum TaxID=2840814 RepID=A0A9D1S4F1_9FIRM|nr:glycosyltransferase family 2 protein [Candidatus Fimadaptatus faecigallinarum]
MPDRVDTLYIVVPCYNEQAVLPETTRRLSAKLHALIDARRVSPDSRVLYVDDGSRDETWNIIEHAHAEDPLFCGAKLSRNRGHQNALLAGLMTARERADMVVSMDADLQDDIDVVDQFLDEYYSGHDIVYGVRSSRASDTAFKRLTGEGFYKLMALLGVELVFNHAEYRLMSRRALEALEGYTEINLFLRGIVPLIGFPSAIVTYERAERFAGETKYPLKKMIAFAVEGITSFSVKPLRLIGWLGALIMLLSIIALIVWLCAGGGTALIACSVWLACGVQLVCAGVVGEYIGKIYSEVKRRPRYFIEKLVE